MCNKQVVKRVASIFLLAAAFALIGCLCACSSGQAASSSSSASSASSESASASTSAGSSAASSDDAVRVMALNGPTGIGMAALSQNDAYDAQFAGSTDEVVSAISADSCDIAAVPTNLASVLYNKTSGGVQLLAVDTYGSLFLLENGETVTSIADLAGKKVYATGEGANPQYIFEYLLRQAGLEPGVDVEIEYLAEHSQLAALVATGEAALALLPEPFVSVAQAKSPDTRIALDLGAEWKAATGNELAMGCVAVRTAFAQEHPDAVTRFLDDLNASVNAAREDVAGTAQLCADLGILPSSEIAQAAIPKCSLVCVTGDEARVAVGGFLGVLFESNPKSVGGALPGDDFYYAQAE